jgi:hypothetical protein
LQFSDSIWVAPLRCRADGLGEVGVVLLARALYGQPRPELTRKRLRRGVHTSVSQLEADIRSFIERHNQNPRPFKWTKSADQILASVKRFCHKAQQTLCGEL